jgi:GTPase SAR1 family protein
MYYRGAQAVILVFALNNMKSFEALDYWVKSLRDNSGDENLIFLVGNKVDLSSDRIIAKEVGEQKATEINAHYFETSAMTGEMVPELFLAVAKACEETAQGKVQALTAITTSESSGCSC